MKTPRSLMLLMPLPSAGMIPHEVHSFLVRLRVSYAQMGVAYEEIILPGLDQAQCRAELLAFYYEHREKFEDVLFLDSDMMTGVEVIHELGRLEEGLVVCPYPQRKRDDDAAASANPLAFWAIDTAGTQATIEVREGRRMVALRGAGLGCCRIRRSVVEKLWSTAYLTCNVMQPEEHYIVTPSWTSKVPGMQGLQVRGLFECITHEHVEGSGVMTRRPEDMSFFLRCKRAGIQPYALLDATMWHAGKPGESLWDALCQQNRMASKARKRVSFELLECPDNLAAGLAEVLDGAYDIPGLELKPHEVILDLGANIGAFAAWCQDRFPGAPVYCFEPEPKNFARLQRNTAHMPAVHLRNFAVCGPTSRGMLYPGQCNDGEWSIHPIEGIHDTSKPVPVKSTPAKNLPPCSILKIDTEGCEVEILEEYRWLGECKAVMLEWHSNQDYIRIMHIMREAGFVPMVDRAKGKPSEHRELCFLRKGVFEEAVQEDEKVRTQQAEQVAQ